MTTSRNKPLPPYCYRTATSISCKPYAGKGAKRKTFRLCDLDASDREIAQRYQALIESLDASHDGLSHGTLAWMLDRFMKSDQFLVTKKARKPKSEAYLIEQRRQATQVCSFPVGPNLTLGDIPIREITPGALTKYCDRRAAESAPIAANREVALISVAWNWAISRDYTAVPNPCSHCVRNPENARDHYVTDHEYDIWLRHLIDEGRPHIFAVSEILYLCRMRKVEVLEARKTQVLEDGFDTLRRKGSRSAITEYSPRLTAALEVLQSDERGRFSPYLVTYLGKPVTIDGFNKMWDRHQRQCVQRYGIRPFTRHDLKRKGASDSDEDATISTGNSAAMTKVYDVSKLRAKATK